MKLGSLIKSALVPAALWALADVALAAPTCKYLTEAVDGVVNLQVSAITVGRDVPIGTEVYRQTFNVAPGQGPVVECSYDAPFPASITVKVGYSAQKANWSQGKYADQVYKTNIDGLGVAIVSYYGASLPKTVKWTFGDTDSNCKKKGTCKLYYNGMPGNQTNNLGYELVFIKIGDVRPGMLNGSSLPIVMTSVTFDNIEMQGLRMRMDGAINIVSRTCSTPDVVVPMGTHLTSSFTQLGSATNWKSFSIDLNNCPAFYGTYTKNPPGWISQGGYYPDGKSVQGTPDKNSLAFRIDSARTAINPNEGVLSLDPSVAGGAPAASGVGIQIANTRGENVVLGKSQSSGVSLRSREGSYSIPLRARYLQTGSQVTPGPANASATFTIIYQ